MAASWPGTAKAVEFKIDPYDNDGEIIRNGLEVADNALLPDIIYPYLPSGNMLQNLGAKDVSNAPNMGALEAIILFMAQSFGINHASSGSGKTGEMLWKLMTMLSVLGMLLSGFLTFKAVTQGKKGPGEAIVGLLIKGTVLMMMFLMICPNLPPMLIGLSNYVTSGIDGWFSYTNSTGATGVDTLKATYYNKMAAGMAAAGVMSTAMTDAMGKTGAGDPKLTKALLTAVNNIKADPDIQTAIGKNGNLSNGLAKILSLHGTANPRTLNVAISLAAQIPSAVVMDRVKAILQDALEAEAAGVDPEPVVNQLVKAPQGIDISGFAYPDRLVSTYGYIAFCYLSLSIWGMGFASLVWAMLYSLPEEWNLGGVLYSGIKGGLTIVVSIVLISIYMGSGLHWTKVSSEELSTKVPGWTDVAYEQAKTILAKATGLTFLGRLASGAASAADIIGKMVTTAASGGGYGDIMGQAIGWFTGMTLEQFMVGLLILTAPAQAAMMVKGANGVGESAAKALNAQGASSQGLAGVFGTQLGGTGVTGGSSAGAGDVMAGANFRRDMAPNVGSGLFTHV